MTRVTMTLFASCMFVAGLLAGPTNGRTDNDNSDDAGENAIPSLIGVWKGTNRTISASKGFKEWEKTVSITEQKDSRFKGSFTYSEGVKNFYGIIHPDGETFTWVSEGSKGFNLGRILDDDVISACYVETGEEMTTGCTEMTRANSDK